MPGTGTVKNNYFEEHLQTAASLDREKKSLKKLEKKYFRLHMKETMYQQKTPTFYLELISP